MEVIQSWPPVTRVLTISTFVLSLLVHTEMISIMYWPFISELIFRLPPKIPEIWRLYTAFCLTGPKFGIFMDTYFMFTYASGLERDSPRFSDIGSFFVYVFLNMVVITLLAGFYLGQYMFLSALILAFAYTFSQDNPNSNVSFYIVSFPARYLPVALLALTFIVSGPDGAKLQATGLIAAHLYDFLTRIWPTFGGGRNYIFTPTFVKRWFVSDGDRPVQERGYGTAVHAPQRVPGDTPWTGQRGPGRRLGGD